MRILLLSSERSGSNLLRLMLDVHSEVSAPPAPHIAKTLGPFRSHYGALEDLENRRSLVGDMTTLVTVHPNPWPKLELDPNSVDPNFWCALDAVYSARATSEGKSSWFAKENNLFDYAYPIDHALDDVRFVYLVRDGRDVACSMRKMPGANTSTWLLAEQWADEQRKCLNVLTDLPDRCHLVRYEDLVESPEETLRSLCEFLGLEFEDGMLSYHKTDAAQSTAEKSQFWSNLSRPVIANNCGKYRSEMNEKDLSTYESIAGHLLNALGYSSEEREALKHYSTRQKAEKVKQFIKRRWSRRRFLQEAGREARDVAIREIHARLKQNVGRGSFERRRTPVEA
ncbi:MAG: sulfotransferase [Planctomycetota bacterium]